MQGVIFNAIEEFVIDLGGMELWNKVLESADVPSGGIYTFGETYDDQEIVDLAVHLCDAIDVELAKGLNLFGRFLFGYLLARGNVQIKDYNNTQALLSELEDVIHKDVKRLHPGAYTPFFEYQSVDQEQGILIYRSKRKLCQVAEGLVQGAAENYGQYVLLQHTHCMHQDAEECRWNLQFSKKDVE